MQRNIILLIVFAVGIGIGLFASRFRTAPPVSQPKPAISQAARKISLAQLDEELASITASTNYNQRFINMSQLAAGVDSNVLPQAVSKVISHPDSYVRTFLSESLFNRWCGVDAKSALFFAQTNSALGASRLNLMRIGCTAWAQKDAAGLAQWAETNQDNSVRRSALMAVIDTTVATNPAAAMVLADKLPNASDKAMSYQNIYSQWAKTDPAAACTNMLAKQFQWQERQYNLTSALQQWASQDPTNAARFVKNLPDNSVRRQAIQSILSAISGKNPTLGIELAGSLPPSEDRASAMSTLASAWANQDALKALAWAQSLQEVQEQQNALRRVLDRLVEWDIKTTLAYMETNLNSPLIRESGGQILWRWMHEHPTEAVAWTKALPPGKARDNLLQSALVNYAETTNPGEAATNATQFFTGNQLNNTLYNVLSRWAATDPAKAAAFLEAHPQKGDSEYLVSTIISSWIDKDFTNATAWVLKLPAGENRKGAERQLVEKLARNNPSAAADLVARFETPEKSLVESLMNNWIRFDLNKASAWVETLPPGPTRQAASERLIRHYAQSSPEKAARLVDQNPPALDSYIHHEIAVNWAQKDPAAAAAWMIRQPTNTWRYGNNPYSSVISAWAKTAPLDAAEFLKKLPNTSQLTMSYQNLASSWAANNPEACGSWILSNAPDSMRREMLRGLVNQWGRRSPEEALNWSKKLTPYTQKDQVLNSLVNAIEYQHPALAASAAELISEERTRNLALESVGRSWLRKSSAEAQAWIKTNSLPEARKKRLAGNKE